jgi:hypothetical protein
MSPDNLDLFNLSTVFLMPRNDKKENMTDGAKENLTKRREQKDGVEQLG